MINIDRSLKAKIFKYFMVFSIILVIVLWLFQTVFFSGFYRTERIKELDKTMLYLEKSIKNKENEYSDILDIIKSISDTPIKLRIFIANNNMEEPYNIKEFVYNYNNGDEFFSTIDVIKLYDIVKYKNNMILDNDYFRKIGFEGKPKEPENFRIQAKLLEKNNGSEILILGKTDLNPVGPIKDTFVRQLYYVSFIMIVISGFMSLLMSNRISKPIYSLNKTAKLLGKGKYDIKFEGKGYREVEELSETLNFTAKELSYVEKMQKELIANVSHDLRTPLTLIKGYAEIMRDIPGENSCENINTIIEETSRLEKLVNDILDISKIQRDIDNIEVSNFNLTKEIEKIISNNLKLLEKEDFSIVFNFKEEVDVRLDKIKIEQAFYNLFINAINHTGEDKRVVINQIVEKDCITIEIIDFGMGIMKDDINLIWKRYYRTDNSHSRGTVGSGIGLSVVREIIDKHNGECGVSSDLGKGSKFWFKVPKELK